MTIEQAKSELMQIYGALSPNKQIAIDTLIKASVKQEPKYCDRNICVSNEYNGIGCNECEVTKSQEPKTGHWIAGVNGHFNCSECNTDFFAFRDIRAAFIYCPYCGVRMVEPQESEDKE